ncbi:MAG TPA: GNAT family N-acetyltransferase [Longimicrobiales bacterium]|nr:GNAT family N-acetyltransferase [Longimicrobiales bacterium]
MSDGEFVVRRHEPAGFRDRASEFLLLAEAENNLVIGLIEALLQGHGAFTEPPYLATVERAAAVVGCTFRTPPYKLGLTRMPVEAVPSVARDVHERFATLPTVLARREQAAAFAAAWTELTGIPGRPGRQQRIYQLSHVTPPAGVPGALRRAGDVDAGLVAGWIEAFGIEADHPPPDPRATARARIAQGEVYLWEDGEPVCMAARAGATPHGERIGLVYTPPAKRTRGYASACTAALSQLVLDGGRRCCFLYTDLGNPVSNSIYRKIGYAPVCDVMDYDFG